MHSMRAGRIVMRLTRVASLALPALIAACDHSTPFERPDDPPRGPLIPGDPVRLTYGGTAAEPAWLPDASGIVFSLVDASRPDDDRCLGVMPAVGGQVTRLLCYTAPFAGDSTDQLSHPAVAGTDLAFVRHNRPVGSVRDRTRWLHAGAWAAGAGAAPVQSIPFMSGTVQVTSVSSLAWLASGRLAFIANGETVYLPCQGCDAVLVEAGRQLIVADLTGAAPALVTVPTAGNPTSVASGGSGDTFYYTLAGDTRVYRQDGAAAPPTVVHDFVGSTRVRDIDVAGGRLAAVVDGAAVEHVTDDGVLLEGGPGLLRIVDLGTGAEQPVHRAGMLFSAPALSPDGSVIAVIGTPAHTNEFGVIVIDGPPDLWRFGGS
jgi:hypothetical protein